MLCIYPVDFALTMVPESDSAPTCRIDWIFPAAAADLPACQKAESGAAQHSTAACGNVLPFINLCHAAKSEIAVAATKNVFSCWNVVVHGRRVRWRWVGMGEWRCGSATQIEFQRSKSWNEINFLNFPSCSLAFRGSGTGVRSPDICIEVAGGVAVNRKVEKFLAPVG